MTRILVVEDDPSIRMGLEDTLTAKGYEVEVVGRGAEGADRAISGRYDLLVLDVMLPDIDGFEVCRRLRGNGIETPVLFLTARDGSDEAVRGLTLGGDDYVTKPFSLEEVVARVQALLRRSGGRRPTSPTLTLADLEMDDDAHVVRRAGETIDLSPTEYNLLRFLLGNAGRVMSRAQILDHVWEYDFGGNDTVVETFISYLRKKIDRFDPPLIHTVRGVGYTLRVA
jgi:two-component system, OmpR family, response regulator